MVDIDTFRQIALSFPETTEQPHFEKQSYRSGKKIFATLDLKNKQACVKLNEVDQDVFSTFDPAVIYPVPNKWGKQGWTLINLDGIRGDMLTDALTTAYCHVSRKNLLKNFKGLNDNL